MNCRDFADRVDEWIDGTLPPGDAETVAHHAADCTACAAETGRARRFRTLLAGRGRDAVVAAADREASLRARASAADAAPRGALHRLRVPAAAAAVLVAGLALGFAAGSWTGGTDAPVGDGGVAVVLGRGERRTLAEGRTLVADESTRIVVEPGSRGERVRLEEGAAVFQVEKGRPFTVVTDLGEADVLGTLFHVERRRDRSVSVGVMSGIVAFRPRGGGTVRTLRAGTILDVAPDGTQRLLSRTEVADLVMRLEMQGMEIDVLRGDLAKRDDEIAALHARLAASGAAPPVTPPDPVEALPWDRLGAAMRDLLVVSKNPRDPARLEALAAFGSHATVLAELTGTRDAMEWPWHPAIIRRVSRSFVDALAPSAPLAARIRVSDAIHGAADECLLASKGALPSQAATARLRMMRATLVALRDDLGPAAAGEVARAMMFVRDGVSVRTSTDDAAGRKAVVDGWRQRWSLPEDRTAEAAALLDPWIAAMKDAQARVERAWGDASAREFLYPTFPRFGPRPADPAGRTEPGSTEPGGRPEGPPRFEPRVPLDDATAVATLLRRIDAKLVLLEPRVALERSLRALLPPEGQARMDRNDDVFLTTWR